MVSPNRTGQEKLINKKWSNQINYRNLLCKLHEIAPNIGQLAISAEFLMEWLFFA